MLFNFFSKIFYRFSFEEKKNPMLVFFVFHFNENSKWLLVGRYRTHWKNVQLVRGTRSFYYKNLVGIVVVRTPKLLQRQTNTKQNSQILRYKYKHSYLTHTHPHSKEETQQQSLSQLQSIRNSSLPLHRRK